jgi:uncharacterized membrane protein
LDTGRVEAFSDGVFAIAITLLVLGLAVPPAGKEHGDLGRVLARAWPSYAAYLVSFLIIGIIWVNHHAMFRLIARADRPLLFMNLGLLAIVAVIPFPTGVLAAYIRHGPVDAHLAAALYSVTMLAMSVAFVTMWLWVTRAGTSLLHEGIDRAAARASARRFGAGNLIYAALVGLSFVSAPVTLALHFIVALYYVFDQLTVGGDPVSA